MNFTKITIFSLVLILGLIALYYFTSQTDLMIDEKKELNNELVEWESGKLFTVLVNPDDFVLVNGKTIPTKATFGLKEGFEHTYNEIGFFDNSLKPLFVIPTFTASAYSQNGFYEFFKNNCNESCLTTDIVSNDLLDYHSSANAVKVLELLGYDSITDIELDKNPDILLSYNSIIILHNEYVTKKMFDAITSHPNVVFLYPNSLYAEISVNYDDKTISLIKGHGYPESSIINGFNWEHENTHPYEFDTKCENWEFYTITNGVMLNCYPEQKIWNDELFLRELKEKAS